ncbi:MULTISPECIES: hypothetical protein [unclassified Cryobacterium]|uniref:hypothetical protein n=1 Tax=unclassified Cryobacterium TaxID=2649013 RepID=UPI00106CFE25|nr:MULTISPECIES: hypothetical protein [unclassified Cryobacterium]TFB99723.1 hypothetical protein E3O39_02990 [Cryobacterium sp. MDB2-A-1]TFC09706.1 hypothetical protein E3O35_14180 [Cryobacterium sp. MDB2-A-2]TFC23962.1 hypothetical protein E3O51_00105 [Cryobacterium sp. MDB2-10]
MKTIGADMLSNMKSWEEVEHHQEVSPETVFGVLHRDPARLLVRSPLPDLAGAQVSVAKDTHAAIAHLVELTEANIGLARQAVEASAASDRFSRRMAWSLAGIAVVSLLVAGASLVVAISR